MRGRQWRETNEDKQEKMPKAESLAEQLSFQARFVFIFGEIIPSVAHPRLSLPALFATLCAPRFPVVTKITRKLKSKLLALFDTLVLRNRILRETVPDHLKTISPMEP